MEKNEDGRPETEKSAETGEPEKSKETQAAGLAAAVFTQADVDRIVKDRLEREKTAREKVALKAKEDAEAEGLKKNQEWQALAQKHEARTNELLAKLDELEPLGDQVDRYKGALESYLVTEKKDLPKHVLVLLEMLDPVEQIEYLAANREELGKVGGKLGGGVPASPEPKARTLSDDDKEAARRGQSMLYQSF